MGITCLVALLGQDARRAREFAKGLLWEPTVANLALVAHVTAGWPLQEDGISLEFVRTIIGMVSHKRSWRTSLSESLTQLEMHARKADLRPGIFDSTAVDDSTSQQIMTCHSMS